jgi:hypothetical protein
MDTTKRGETPMATAELEHSLESLMADARLVELCELQRTGDEVLDVISLSENQHSDILAWMLDAKEGHGQGDEILRDLLISASVRASSGGSGLDGRGTTARFFAAWPPSRIRTTSFGAAFTARELGMKANERVDLFVIDAQNKFILLIENKAGASHSEKQLNLYWDSFGEAVQSNPRLREYEHVFVALDRELDIEDETPRPSANSWLHLGYDWLERSATRALMHVKRGNSAARLVVSYCNRQTGWESPENEKCLGLAADLHKSYPEAVKHLIGFSRGRLEREWLTKRNDQSHLMFLLQNKSAIAMLKDTDGMASVKAAVLAHLPSLPPGNVQHKRAWLDMCPSGWEHFQGENWWTVFLSVRYADTAKSRYSLSLIWNGKEARTEAEAEELRGRLTTVLSKFDKHSDSRWRRVVLEKSLTHSDLLARLAEFDSRLRAALVQ